MEITKLYDGKVELGFDPVKHLYSVDGKIVYGITNIVKILDKPQLMYWAVNVTIGYYTEFITKVLSGEQKLTEVTAAQLHDEAKYAHRKVSSTSMLIGTLVHDWIERYIKAGLTKTEFPERPQDEQLNHSIDAFFKWTKERHLKFKQSEKKVLSLKNGYAGTMDAEADEKKARTVIDFKTSTGIYMEYWLQVAGYLFAREEETGKRYSGGWVVRIDKNTGELETEYKSRKELLIYFKAFLNCLNLYKFQMYLKTKEK